MPTFPAARNQFLEGLPQPDRDRLLEHAEPVSLAEQTLVCQPGERIQDAWFPLSSMFSAIVVLDGGSAVEAGTIGHEGMVGVGLLVGERSSPHRVVQQVPGESLRIDVADLQNALRGSDALRVRMERYALALLQQAGQNAACNLRHGLEERMCRWLLATSDRAGGDEFRLTQEFLAEMLGVRRQTVNITARLLQSAGLIQHRRGRVQVIDREGLRQSACECFEVNKRAYERYLRL